MPHPSRPAAAAASDRRASAAPPPGAWKRRLAAGAWPAALVVYFALAAACTAIGHPLPAALLLAVLLAAALVRAAAARHWDSAAFVGLNLALVVTVLAAAGAHDALSLTLVVVQGGVSALFFRSLRRGRTDIVTRIACTIHSERSARVRAYTRAVSWSWAWFMALLAVVSLVFTFAAPPRLWWWWNNVGSIALPVTFFAAEWTFRQFFLRREEKPGVRPTLRALARIDYQGLFQA